MPSLTCRPDLFVFVSGLSLCFHASLAGTGNLPIHGLSPSQSCSSSRKRLGQILAGDGARKVLKDNGYVGTIASRQLKKPGPAAHRPLLLFSTGPVTCAPGSNLALRFREGDLTSLFATLAVPVFRSCNIAQLTLMVHGPDCPFCALKVAEFLILSA